MLRCCRILVFFLVFPGCGQPQDAAVNWNSIDFREYACSGKTANPGCNSPDDQSIATSGRGKGK